VIGARRLAANSFVQMGQIKNSVQLGAVTGILLIISNDDDNDEDDDIEKRRNKEIINTISFSHYQFFF
jgi:hypothetical protein